MNEPEPIDARAQWLMDAACNDTLTAAEVSELEQLLAADKQLQEQYLLLFNLQTDLAFVLRAEQANRAVQAQIAAELQTTSPAPAAYPTWTHSPLLGFLNRLPAAIQPAQHPLRFLSVAALLTSIFWIGVLVLVMPREATPPLHPDTDNFAQLTPFHARVLRLDQVEWATGQRPLLPGSSLALEETVSLAGGRIDLLFGSGARAVIEGPAELRIIDRSRMALVQGRLLAQADQAARGFAVETPLVRVVDLGTEFGLEVGKPGTEVQVFDGNVAVLSAKDRAAQKHLLAAGEAALFGSSPETGSFVKEKKMNRMTFLALATVLALPSVQVAQATPISVPNFSFENPILGDITNNAATGNGDSTTIPNWIVGMPAADAIVGVFNPGNASYAGATGGNLPAPAAGPQNAFLHLASTTLGQTATLTSAASLGTIQDSSTYSLTVAAGRRLEGTLVPATVSIMLLANGTPIPGATATINGSTITAGTFVDLTTSFTTAFSGDSLTGQALTVRLLQSKATGTASAMHVNFDNVRLNLTVNPAPVPEPASAAILGAGSLVFLGFRRRSRS